MPRAMKHSVIPDYILFIIRSTTSSLMLYLLIDFILALLHFSDVFQIFIRKKALLGVVRPCNSFVIFHFSTFGLDSNFTENWHPLRVSRYFSIVLHVLHAFLEDWKAASNSNLTTSEMK